MKRKAAQSVDHLFKSGVAIFELRERFDEDHPDYAEFFDYSITAISLLCDQLRGVYAKAWGYFPDDLSTWMH